MKLKSNGVDAGFCYVCWTFSRLRRIDPDNRDSRLNLEAQRAAARLRAARCFAIRQALW